MSTYVLGCLIFIHRDALYPKIYVSTKKVVYISSWYSKKQKPKCTLNIIVAAAK